MSKKIYTQKQIDELLINPCVEKCAWTYITFSSSIKYDAVVLWKTWLTWKEIFKKFKFPDYIINSNIPTKCISRWNKTINEKWKDWFNISKRWIKADYTKLDIENMSKYEVYDYFKIKMKYLEEELKLLKWIKKKLTKSQKFSIILKIYEKNNLQFLCNLAEVSISWFYAYKVRVKKQNTRIDKDKNDYEIINDIYLKSNKEMWYRAITMELYRIWKIMNHKKVYRITREYDLLSIIRRKNPYKKIQKATQEHKTCKNIINRNFKWTKAFKKLWTDISYLYYNGTKAYLSILKDMISWEVVSHKVSSSLWLWFVINTINEAKDNFNLEWAIIQSDQWFHYTHPEYINLLKKNWIIQSMSRKWNCLDNAPTESFFWHMKDEINLKEIKSYSELVKYINSHIFNYNNNRPQWNRKKMTPIEYRNHLLVNNN